MLKLDLTTDGLDKLHDALNRSSPKTAEIRVPRKLLRDLLYDHAKACKALESYGEKI